MKGQQIGLRDQSTFSYHTGTQGQEEHPETHPLLPEGESTSQLKDYDREPPNYSCCLETLQEHSKLAKNSPAAVASITLASGTSGW